MRGERIIGTITVVTDSDGGFVAYGDDGRSAEQALECLAEEGWLPDAHPTDVVVIAVDLPRPRAPVRIKAAIALPRQAGKALGGIARALALTPERRKEIAAQAAKARWSRAALAQGIVTREGGDALAAPGGAQRRVEPDPGGDAPGLPSLAQDQP